MAEIMRKLNIGINPEMAPLAGYVLYTLIFLYGITMLLQKKGTLFITVLMAIAIMCALIDKVEAIQPTTSFGVYAIRILMFTLPLVVAGMTKWEKSRPSAILAGLIALVYMFIRWFAEMRPS